MKVLGIIPARYGSSRFPGKPLCDIQGKSMIQRVYEQASRSTAVSKVVVATDDDRIFKHVQGFGAQAMMTSSDHQSGTDRCLETYHTLGEKFDVVINIQGDEPLLDPDQLSALSDCFEDQSCQIATLATKMKSEELLFDPSKIKLTLDVNGNALYFSRQAIPFQQKPKGQWLQHHSYLQHIGVYAFRGEVLKEVAVLPQSSLEKAESLEQLRWMENGYKIRVCMVDHDSVSVDIPEDVERVIRILNDKK